MGTAMITPIWLNLLPTMDQIIICRQHCRLPLCGLWSQTPSKWQFFAQRHYV